MNKAEEQYLYWWGWNKAKADMMTWSWPRMEDFIKKLNEYCYRHIEKNASTSYYCIGNNDFITSVINSINGGIITDWPSFVTHMTGETYEKEVGHE